MEKPDSRIKQALKEVQKIKSKMEEEPYIIRKQQNKKIKKQMNYINQVNFQMH